MGRDIVEFRNKSIDEMPHSEVESTWKILERLGFDAEVCYRFRSDQVFRKQFIQFGLRHAVLGGEFSKVDVRLRELMLNRYFFGVDDWRFFFDIKYPDGFEDRESRDSWLKNLEEILYEDCPFVGGAKVMDTHFLYYLPSLTTTRKLFLKNFFEMVPRFGDGSGCGPIGSVREKEAWLRMYQSIASNVPVGNWFLCFLGVLPFTRGENFNTQLKAVPDHYRVPYGCEIISMFKLFSLMKFEPYFYHAWKNHSLYGFVADQFVDDGKIYCHCFQSDYGDHFERQEEKSMSPSSRGILVSRKLDF